MYNILRILFLFFFYFSNASTILSIYPISFYLIRKTSEEYGWYYFGLLYSIYELGKFCGIPVWEYLYKNNSKLILVLISLFFLAILNISFSFISEFYHIIIIRFLFGFSNITGSYFKDIYIQIGFRKNNKIIILLISIVSTIFSLFFPSIIIYFNLGEKLLPFGNIKLKNIMLIYLCLAISNLLPILFCYILIAKNKLKIEQKFYIMTTNEKTENSVEKSLGHAKNNFAEAEPKYHSKVIKVKHISDSNLQISPQKNMNNENDSSINKERKNSENKNFNNQERKDNDINVEQIININSGLNQKYNINENKEYQLSLIQIFLSMVDGLSLIWTLIILYNKFKEKCLTISIYISLFKLLGEIILFPINERIMHNSSSLIPLDFKPISNKMKYFVIILIVTSITIGINIFSIYYYSKYDNLLLLVLFFQLIFRTIMSGIFTQYYKIYINLYFKQNNIKSNKLKNYNQYGGSIGKFIIFIVGSFGLYIMNLLYNSKMNKEILISLFYFEIIPILIYIILFWACSKYIN
jgi:hypothetical protein